MSAVPAVSSVKSLVEALTTYTTYSLRLHIEYDWAVDKQAGPDPAIFLYKLHYSKVKKRFGGTVSHLDTQRIVCIHVPRGEHPYLTEVDQELLKFFIRDLNRAMGRHALSIELERCHQGLGEAMARTKLLQGQQDLEASLFGKSDVHAAEIKSLQETVKIINQQLTEAQNKLRQFDAEHPAPQGESQA
jgi:hypothetical protein